MKAKVALLALVGVLAVSGCTMIDPNAPANGTGTSCSAGGTIPQIPGMSADRQIKAQANAQAIAAAVAEQGLSVNDTLRATEIAETVALTESTMEVLEYGDMTGPGGSMSSSRGLYQQLAAWGPLEDRLDVKKSTKMFLNGGAAGQKGLLDISGWQNMPIPQAAQAVQLSEFTDGSRFARNLTLGQAIAAAVTGTGVSCTSGTGAGGTGGVQVVANGPSLTLPDNPNIAAAVRGKTIKTPNAGVAKGIAAGMSYLGTMYVWGGGGDGSGPNNGCSRGGGQLNSCGTEIGFDCSGLTAYVLAQGGFGSPGGNSGAQRAGGQSISYAQGLPGDIVGFPGHVAIYLGLIDGLPYILEASQVGTPIHVVPLTRSDKDPQLHRYWTATTA